jgi:hypothetical protein
MLKKYSLLIASILTVFLFSSCATNSGNKDQADQVLRGFFKKLALGEYEMAVTHYAGSYETLISFNPDLDPDDHAALWQSGCQVNGLQCLTVRTSTFKEINGAGEYIFTVEFNTQEGILFELGNCCGDALETPPISQFEYRVVKGDDGQFRVLDMPVYVP